MKNNSRVARRQFLKIAGLVATLGASFGFASRCADHSIITSQSKSQESNIKPINVSSDRVIRTIVGLRPYRPSGFVVKSERLTNKILIHNYGHGGAGVTLSWGTSKLAFDL